jgi:hypothetical protein
MVVISSWTNVATFPQPSHHRPPYYRSISLQDENLKITQHTCTSTRYLFKIISTERNSKRGKGYTTRKTWRCRYPNQEIVTTTSITWTWELWKASPSLYILLYLFKRRKLGTSNHSQWWNFITFREELLQQRRRDYYWGDFWWYSFLRMFLSALPSISFTRPQNGRQLECLTIIVCRVERMRFFTQPLPWNYLRRYGSSVANDLHSTNFGQ